MPSAHENGRRRRHFPLRLNLRWRSLATREDGEGQIINISSTKILFTAGHEFAVGEKIRLSISWPVKLNCKYPLRLLTVGKVVHCKGRWDSGGDRPSRVSSGSGTRVGAAQEIDEFRRSRLVGGPKKRQQILLIYLVTNAARDREAFRKRIAVAQ